MILAIILVVVSLTLYSYWWFRLRKVSIYLLDYSCVKCSDDYKTNLESMLYFYQQLGSISPPDMVFQLKVFLKSGIGEEAYVPRVNLQFGRRLALQHSHDLAHTLVIGSVHQLIKKMCIDPRDIDVLVVNSGTFSPTPSLSSTIINHFKMREDVRSFELDGMGCSASLIAIDLAKDILQARHQVFGHRHPRLALVASTEVINSFYEGSDRSMMVTNCLFRCAGNAVLLSNRASDRSSAKFKLLHLTRVNTAARNESYNCVIMQEDEKGNLGAKLSPQLLKVASNALTLNLTRLAPRVLPFIELARVAFHAIKMWISKTKALEPYVPNFKLVFNHFCIHPGGKAVIQGIGTSLKLNDDDIEPSLMALHRFGNTSCSGIWYILSYMEAKKRLRKGDKVLQIGLGSGFKCTSAVWKVLHTINEPNLLENPWGNCIHRYPVRDQLSSLPHVQCCIDYVKNSKEYGGYKL